MEKNDNTRVPLSKVKLLIEKILDSSLLSTQTEFRPVTLFADLAYPISIISRIATDEICPIE